MNRLIYKNKIVTSRFYLSEQINNRDTPSEKHDFAFWEVMSDSDSQLDTVHLLHQDIGDEQIGRLRPCCLQSSDWISE